MKITGREIAVVSGRWRERPLDAATEARDANRPPAKGELLVLLAVYPEKAASDSDSVDGRASGREPVTELLDPSASALADELRRRLVATYYQDPARSVTASLGRAIQSTNAALSAANEANPPEVRRFAAIACVVAREGEVFLAIAGPATAHLAVEPSVESFAAPEWTPAGALVGSSPEVMVEFAHRTLDAPATLVLHASSLASALPDGQVADLLSSGSDGGALANLRRAIERGPTDLMAMVVEIQSASADGITTPIPWPAERDEGSRPVAVESVAAEADAATVRRRARRPRRAVPAPSRSILLGAAALVAALLFYLVPVRLFLDYQAVQSQQGLVREAQAKEQEARAATDPGSRLKLLVEASNLASKATQTGRAEPSVSDLERRLRTEVEALTSTVRLGDPSRLTSLDGQPTQIVLGGSDLFVLDRGSERVFRFPLEANRLGVQSTASPVVFRKGDKLGEQAFGAPRQILWMPGGSGRAEGFLILDSTGALYEWDASRPGLKLSLPNRGNSHVPLIAGYAGTLYTLDVTDNLLEWRPPSSGVYDMATYPYLQPDVAADVSDVLSLAVGEDLYVLRKSGQIDRFTLGKPSTFANAPPDRPLGVGSTITATARGVYAFDPTNHRIVQFARDGTYRRQFVLDGRDDLVDVALDESRGLIYALCRQGIYLYRSSDLAALPPTSTPAVTPALTPGATPARTPAVTPAATAKPAATPAVKR